jgi:hypothetical protein
MTKRWSKYKIGTRYPNLHNYKNDERVVDLLLHNGDVVNMCIWKFDGFFCIEKFIKIIDEKSVSKIRLTHKKILRYKKHHWGSHNFCLRCSKLRTFPAPKECDIIWYSHYPTANPDYEKNKKVTPTFKKQESIFYPIF